MEQTILQINEWIKQQLTQVDIKDFALAESVAVRSEDGEVTFPALILPNGEGINVYAETDKHDVTLYHRLNSISYQDNENVSIGSARGYTEVDDISLIVFGKRKKQNKYELERVIIAALSKNNHISISRSDFNALQIFASEFTGVTYFLGTEYYLFKINYSITSTLNTRCINK